MRIVKTLIRFRILSLINVVADRLIATYVFSILSTFLESNSTMATFVSSELPRPIPWNQTSDVHRGPTLITWRLRKTE